jgi:hypothetical protein
MSRPTSMTTPIPGDPEQVRRLSMQLAAVETRAREIESRLRAIETGVGPQMWRGRAADGFTDEARLRLDPVSAQDAEQRRADTLGRAEGRPGGRAMECSRGQVHPGTRRRQQRRDQHPQPEPSPGVRRRSHRSRRSRDPIC